MSTAQAPLSPEDLAAASKLRVLDEAGASVEFGSIFAEQRTVLVLIRHFWCGSCQDYVASLAKVPMAAFEQAGVKLVVIGCGEPSMIRNYKATTGFPHAMYADPTRKLYDTLGAQANLDVPDEQPSYLQNGNIANIFRSIWRGPILQPTSIGKQGKLEQLGGDFVVGPGLTCSFAWRMRNTQDHITVEELMKHAGVDYTV